MNYTCEDDDAFNEMLAYGVVFDKVDVPFRRICKDEELTKIVIRHVKLNSYEVRIFVKELARRKMTKFVRKLSAEYDIPNQYMKFACQSGSFKAIKLARQLECGWSYGYESFIVMHDRLDILKWMHENKFYFDWETLAKYASMCGNRSIYEWTKKKAGKVFIATFCSHLSSGSVVFNGGIEILKFAMKTYPKCHNQIFRGIVNAGNLQAVEYYLKRYKIAEVVVHPSDNNLKCLKYIVAHGVKIHPNSRSYIDKHASADLMEWLFDNVESMRDYMAESCINMGFLFLLKRMKRSAIPANAIEMAVRKGKLDIVIWLVSIGSKVSEFVFDCAVRSGNVRMLKWVDKNLLPTMNNVPVIRHSGNMEISQYLESRGISLDRSYTANDVKRLTIEYVEKYPRFDRNMYNTHDFKHIELCVFKKIPMFIDHEVINDLKKVRSVLACRKFQLNYINNLHPEVIGEIFPGTELIKQQFLSSCYDRHYLDQIFAYLVDNCDIEDIIKEAARMNHNELHEKAMSYRPNKDHRTKIFRCL